MQEEASLMLPKPPLMQEKPPWLPASLAIARLAAQAGLEMPAKPDPGAFFALKMPASDQAKPDCTMAAAPQGNGTAAIMLAVTW